ncbi:MAG: hypothetical protein VB858_16210 [Planctomycetaceae bacterium]
MLSLHEQEQHRSVSAPLRVAAAGLTRAGLFHLESFALRREFSLVAVAGTDAVNVDGCRQVPLSELVSMELDLAVIATAVPMRSRVACEFLSAGTNVLIESGFEIDETGALENCLKVAQAKGLYCGLWQPELYEQDYRAAKSVVDAGDCGAVRSVRLLQHNLTAGLRSREPVARSVVDMPVTGARAVVRRRVSQLLNLCAGPVSSAWIEARHAAGTLSGNQVDDDAADPAAESGSPHATAVTVHVQFVSGATALIDVDVASSSSINTGWILQTISGGYHNGHQSQVESDGEVYLVPCESAEADAYAWLAEILNSSPSERVQESEKSVQSEVRTARLLDIVRCLPET